MAQIFEVRPAVTVTLVSAKNLKAAGFIGKSDPYAVITNSNQGFALIGSQKSPIVHKDLNPVWNYTFPHTLWISETDPNAALRITVWDKEKIGSDDYLGETDFKLPIEMMKHKNTVELTQDLVAGEGHSKEKKISGSVTIKVLFDVPRGILTGATFTFSGDVEPSIAGHVQNPAAHWEGKGNITVSSLHCMEFHFQEIKRTDLAGKVWVYDQPISFEFKVRPGNSRQTMTIPKTATWDSEIVFDVMTKKWIDTEFQKLSVEIRDIQKLESGESTTPGKWTFDITPKI
eukprot:Phypoly_transcript_15065.p1 GENE.Phypoly_transcript_15065~~Phypoly_transcript_15065.p1  ORF type:complete len:287 (+),score=44.13 Phypoly_transcript_15065:79-939(+)